MILNFDAYTMLNESFKSRIIADLFKNGELEADTDYAKALFNQVTDKEVIGVADTEEEAKKLLHDTLGDKIVHRHHIYWKYNGEEYEPLEDYDRPPYEVNRTVDEYKDWVFQLKNGKYLVLRIEKRDLDSRFSKIKSQRSQNKYKVTTKFEKDFANRKKFVEANKNDIKVYWKFKKFIEEKGLLDEFVKTTNGELNTWLENIINDNDFESEVCANDGKYYYENDGIEYMVGDLKFSVCAEAEFDGDVRYWNYPGNYWEPADEGCELESGELYVDYIEVSVYSSKDEELYVFKYLPEFDKKSDLCNVYLNW